MSRLPIVLWSLVLSCLIVNVGWAHVDEDSTGATSRYEVGAGGALLTTAHAPMGGASLSYIRSWEHVQLKGHLSYQLTVSTRGGIAETDTQYLLMLGRHQRLWKRRVALNGGIGGVFGQRYSGISVLGAIPLMDRFVGVGIPLEVNATLFRIGSASVGASVFGFVQAASLTGEQGGSSLRVRLTVQFVDLF